VANIRRNAGAELDRRARWAPMRDAYQAFLADYVGHGDRVAIVGAGNGDDLPLRWLAARAGRIDLFDLDVDALHTARRRLAWRLGRWVRVCALDITDGAADAIVRAARDRTPVVVSPTRAALSEAPYDLVVGDLFYSQLLSPALGDVDVDDRTSIEVLRRHGQRLTDAAVARTHASAPRGVVVHVHDPLAWWPGHEHPFTIDDALARAAHDPDPAHVLAGAVGPIGCDPRVALTAERVVRTSWWRWPFAPEVDYLVCATAVVPGPQRR
jgi:hypothetical protein